MKKTGISVYVEKDSEKNIKDYITKAASHGFSRLFSCLLSVDGDKEALKQKFLSINSHAKEEGFEVIVDVSPRVFKDLGISYDDLSFFSQIGADGIRLDIGYSGKEEAMMTFNPQNLKIEINMSNNTHYLDTIMDYMPNRDNLVGCHNFYPHRYSGLGFDHFKACTDRFKSYGLKTAAFVSSNNEDTFGPWPVTEGLPTLEIHRNLPLKVQAKHLIALGGIDDIIISNCYATDEELRSLSQMRKDMVTFEIETVSNLPATEEKIIFEEIHDNRGDVSENLVRSTQSRVKYKGHAFDVFNPKDPIERGDVIIESDLYGHYAGELQIARTTMKNSGKTNVVGHITEAEHFIIDTLRPWQKFSFSKRNE